MDAHAKSSKLEEAGQLANVRARLYDFLADQVIHPPIREDQTTEQLLERWRFFAEAIDDEGARENVAYLASGEFSAEVLNQEHSDLFVVPAGRYLAPIESVYGGGTVHPDGWTPGILRGAAWNQVAECYRRAGFTLPPQSGFEADHLGCELQFLAVLCRAERQAWLEGDFEAAREFRTTQREFVRDHPLTWTESLRRRFGQLSTNPYYGHLLALIDAYLQIELEQLRGDEAE